MYQKKKLPIGYIQDLNCKVLELPYQGEELSMVILLPEDIEDESTGLKKVPAIGITAPFTMLCLHFPYTHCTARACCSSIDFTGNPFRFTTIFINIVHQSLLL